MKKAILFINLLLLVSAAKGVVLNTEIKMISPDGHISAEISQRDGHLFYTVKAGQQLLINNGTMGLVIDGIAYGSRVNSLSILAKRTASMGNKVYHIYTLLLEEAGRKYNMEFRLSNEGTAFRYIFDSKTEQYVTKELTAFVLPKSRVWFFERNSAWKLKSYAKYHGR